DRTASVVRIGEATLDLNDSALATGLYGSTDRRQVGIKPLDEFPGSLNPLPDDRADQPQKHRLLLEELPEAANLHFGDEFFVKRRADILPSSRGLSRVPHRREALVK